MRNILPKSILDLADICLRETGKPLYIVGGSVRDFLARFSLESSDFDLCAPIPAEIFSSLAKKAGFVAEAVYAKTSTVKFHFTKNGESATEKKHPFEYAAFRTDKYVRGVHTPAETFFTEDILLDAKRRDFTCNAVYYDVARGAFVDPLGGINDIRFKRLKTVDRAEKVFGEDGLRLMRLARMAGTTGFTPDDDALRGAKANAALIKDVCVERVFEELCLCLLADEKYGVKGGVLRALSLLDSTRVLDGIFPELTAGRGITQRADFHDHDVLEHSLRAAEYADKSIRLAALLHDIGKPAAYLSEGRFSSHPVLGEKICQDVLQRLKAPVRVAKKISTLTLLHMYDYDLGVKENKLRRFIVAHADVVEDLLLLKQADYSACKDDLSPAPCVVRWQKLIEKMKSEGTPFSLKQLAVDGNDLSSLFSDKRLVGQALQTLLLHTAIHPEDNEKERLLILASNPRFFQGFFQGKCKKA